MINEKITLEKINRLRYARIINNEEANKIVTRLVDEEIISDSNDYMMAQNALVAGYYWGIGETEAGKAFIKRAKEFAEYATDRISLIDVYVLAGNYASSDDNYNEGLKWYFKALDLSLVTDYTQQISRIYNNIGTIFVEFNDYDKGLHYLLQAEKYSKRYSDTRITSTLYNNLLEIYIVFDDHENARHYVDLIEKHCCPIMTKVERLNYIVNKWKYVLMLGRNQEAELLSQEAQKLLEELPNGNDQNMNKLYIFDVLIKMGRDQEAIETLEKNIASLEAVQSYHNLKKFYDKLIQYYQSSGDEQMRIYYISKNYDNDLFLQKVKNQHFASAINTIDKEYHEKEAKRKENEKAYFALNDENLKLLAVNNNLRAINDIGVRILSTTDLEEIYTILLDKVNALFQVKEFAIGILNNKKDALLFRYSGEQVEAKMESAKKKLTDQQSLSIKCFLENKEIIINDCESEDPDRYSRNLERGEKLSSLLFFPIIVDDKPFGVISVQHEQKHAFAALHIEVFRLLVTFASVSFKNAQHNMTLTGEIEKRIAIQNELEEINTQLDYLARHDELTDVFNRRTFERAYEKAFLMAQILGSDLAVMILDIDHFKQYNDYYGHLRGDECIVRVATALKRVLKRREDIVARYGGDEFMILLPDTDINGAELIAKKLIEAVRAEGILHDASDVSDVVTISLGSASKRIMADDKSEALLNAADRALYKAKRDLGRNAYSLA